VRCLLAEGAAVERGRRLARGLAAVVDAVPDDAVLRADGVAAGGAGAGEWARTDVSALHGHADMLGAVAIDRVLLMTSRNDALTEGLAHQTQR
jgi:hypothetical protein